MLKKALAVLFLSVFALFMGPVAANASGYVPEGNVTVNGTPTPSGAITVDFSAGSFDPFENVDFAFTGEGGATIAMVKLAVQTVHFTKKAAADGSVSFSVTLPTGATGTYNATATGATSGNVGTAAVTVAPEDSGGIPLTGEDFSIVIVWAAGGALLLGIALLTVMSIARKQRTRV